MILHNVQDNQLQKDRLMSQLNAFLEDPKDRALFDLSPKTTASDSAAPENLPTLVYKPRK